MSDIDERKQRFSESRKDWNKERRSRLRTALYSLRGQTIVLELHDGRRMSATVVGVDQDEVHVIDQGNASVAPPKPITTLALDHIREARLP